MTTDVQIENRIAELERELSELHGELGRRRGAWGSSPFEALELRVRDALYLLPVAAVDEVLAVVWPTPLPDAPPWVMGTFRLGDRTVPMIDVAHRFVGSPSRLRADLVMIVLHAPRTVGLVVDEARGVVRVDPGSIVPQPPGIPHAAFLLGTVPGREGHSAALLSPELLASDASVDV